MDAAKLKVSVEPFQHGKVTYLPMAPGTSKGKSRGRSLLRLQITNKEPANVEVQSVDIAFPGSAVPSETKSIGMNIGPGSTAMWWFPTPADDVLFDLPGPTKIELRFECAGFDDPTIVDHPFAPHASPGPRGTYLFPASTDDLEVGEFWNVNGCTHGTGEQGSQSFAYDMGVWGVDHATGVYGWNRPGTGGTENEHLRVWGKQIRAMANGVVIEALNDCPGNPAPLSWTDDADLAAQLAEQQANFWGSYTNGGAGNHLYVRHDDEVVLYAHMQEDSIPKAVAKKGATVTAGQVIGLAGNSGSSSAPHLHIHAIRGTAPEAGPLAPIVLRDAWAVDNDLFQSSPVQGHWSRLSRRGIPEGSTAEWWVGDVFVSPSTRGPQWPEIVELHVPEAKYQVLVTSMKSNGFRPVWIESYTIQAAFPPMIRTFFNVIFRPALGVAWEARHGLDGDEYQAEYVTWVEEKGYRIAHLESYWSVARGRLCYAPVFVKEAGAPQAAYHDRTKAQHQELLDDLTGEQGFVPVSISVVPVDGERRYTGLYEQRDAGIFEARSTLSIADYQTTFNSNHAAGRSLVYLNSYIFQGEIQIVAIWHQNAPAGAANHHLDRTEFQADLVTQRNSRRYLRCVTGYQRGSDANWAALWTR